MAADAVGTLNKMTIPKMTIQLFGSILRGFLALVLTLLGALLAQPAQAQTTQFDVIGVVTDSAGAGLGGAMVVALTSPDSILTKYATTNGEGAFALRRVPVGEYILQLSLIGYHTFRRDFAVTDSDVTLGTVNLNIAAVGMDTLFVSPEHVPFVNRRDTLDYNTMAFQTRPNATVEDLLRRLPGIEVEADGSIKAQGETVQNVLVDGKEFFGSDPTIATKNLPAEVVERVQVYDKQSDMAEFSGIPDGEEERTINLELKEEAKNGYFGKITSGLGADGGTEGVTDFQGGDGVRYDENFNLSRFSPTTQLALLANLNNMNQAGFSWGDYQNFAGGAQGLGGGGGRGGGGGGGGGGRDDGFTETLAVGLNASRDFGEKSWIRSSYFLSSLDNLQNSAIQQQQLLGSEVSSFSGQTSNQTTDNLTHRVDLNAQYTFTEGHDFRLRGGLTKSSSSLNRVGFQETKTVSGQILNTASTNYVVKGDDLGGNARLTWRKRLGEGGRTILAEASANLNEPDLSGDLSSTTGLYDRGDLVTYDEIVQDQQSHGRMLSQSQRLSFTQPFSSGRVVEVFGEHRAVDEDKNKSIYDLNGGTPVFNPLLSSDFERTYSYVRGGLRFNRNSENSWLVLGLQLQNSDLDGTVLNRDERITSGYTHVLPSASFKLQFKPGWNMNLRYSTSTREPTMTQLQPFADNSNPLNVYVGNPDLTPEYSHSFNADYRYFDQFSFLNFFTFFRVTFTKDDIVQSRTVDERGFQEVTPVNSGQGWSANGGVNFGRPIRPMGARINLNFNVTYSTGSEFINQAENESKIWRNTVDASLENRDKELFDVRAGSRLTFNNVGYSLNEELNQSYLNSTFFANGSYYLGDLWTFTSSLNYRVFDQAVFGPGENVALWQASISRLLMNERAEIQLIGFDLLNQNQGVNVNSSSSSIREERTESLSRYLVLKFIYKVGLGSGGGGFGGRGGRDSGRR